MERLRHILITGASSGLGRALALAYSDYDRTLCLLGRDEVRLEETARTCREKGAKVVTEMIDVTDENAMAEWINATDRQYPFDYVFANAGISAGTSGGGEAWAQVKKIFDVNVNGVFNTIQPLIPLMKVRKSGQIVLISSMASYRGLPSSPAYSASKAAVRVYGEGLRGSLHDFGVGVTVVAPGYIKSPMTDVNEFPMPFLISAEKAADIIKKALPKNPARIVFPKRFYAIMWLMSLLPPGWTDRLFRNLPGKASIEAQQVKELS